MPFTGVPAQTVWLFTALTVGVGFTVMVNVAGVPVQPLAEGVTVTVAVMGVLPVLVAAKMAISPFPLAARPMLGSELVQAYVVPVTLPVKLMAFVFAPLHNVWGVTAFTVGVGFTVIVNITGVPAQPAALGVAVIVAVTGVLPVLVAVKEAMSPFPLAARPILGSELVQAYVVPVVAPPKLMAVVFAPLHKV